MQTEAAVASQIEALKKSGEQAIIRLRVVVAQVPSLLREMSPLTAATKALPGKWSPQEELGHLVDSASNNHQSIVRAQSEDLPKMPGYNGDGWVALHRYQHRGWHEVIATWSAFNQQLLVSIEAAPDSASARTCTISGSEPLTISFILSDYVDHMLHHLRHIGIAVDDIVKTATAGEEF